MVSKSLILSFEKFYFENLNLWKKKNSDRKIELFIFPNSLSICYTILKSGIFFKLVPILIQNWSLKVPIFIKKGPYFRSLVLEALI